ncbi:GNAT family N-acetyltransferase [Mucilaginibacter hurinus]|uniref:GNAT family N-acetyltransferase n=1 Tax=Mucilaginibacter hurinus TaxID=2201324 RepID=A0A367GLS1_9SPHI|nr:GNAT family N-acetyltransferase [Mucilaginibacter hurinus]RCH54432.1 GNAT family N-acetyltransferase [Mucilaginibacter hurinus]
MRSILWYMILKHNTSQINFTIRRAAINDIDQIRRLFYDTVTTVNRQDYNAEQIEAWASGRDNIERWHNRVNQQFLYLVNVGNALAGFASLTPSGYIDVMFVSINHQRLGVAKYLMAAIESKAGELGLKKIISDVSITARPFFEKQGFVVTAEQAVEVKGVVLTNFKMEKALGICS